MNLLDVNLAEWLRKIETITTNLKQALACFLHKKYKNIQKNS